MANRRRTTTTTTTVLLLASNDEIVTLPESNTTYIVFGSVGIGRIGCGLVLVQSSSNRFLSQTTGTDPTEQQSLLYDFYY